MTGFILRAVIAAGGLWLASVWVAGITFDNMTTLLIAAVVLGLINALIKPIAVILTFPITIVTLGLFLLVVNAGMLLLVAKLVNGFDIATFWSAFLGSLIISLAGAVGGWFINSKIK